jgi:hypothetical protein
LGLGQIKKIIIKNKLNMNNMCKHLTTKRSEYDGSILATCAIRERDQVSKKSQTIMAAYTKKTSKNAPPNKECQFYYESQERNNPDFITECPCNPRNPNFTTECPCNK